MFSSPAPNRRGARAAQPSSRQGTPRVSPQNPHPRLGHALPQANSRIPASASVRYGAAPPPPMRSLVDAVRDQEMDVDNQAPTVEQSEMLGTDVLAHRPELSVSFFASLPLEVQQALRSTDLATDAYSGTVDSATGFGLIISLSTCFVWNCAKRGLGSSTCYIFPAPDFRHADGAPTHLIIPVASIVPYSSSREPGLIVCSATGEVRFWDSIAPGLAGAEKYHTTRLPVSADEYVTALYRCEPFTYIATTTFGRLFRLTITTVSGKSQVIAAPFTRSQSVFSRVTSTFFSSASASVETGAVAAVAIGQGSLRDGRDIWVLTERLLQKWRISGDSWEQVLLEQDIRPLVCQALAANLAHPETMSTSAFELEFLAVESTRTQELIILVSYSGELDPSSLTSGQFVRSYAIICMAAAAGSLEAREVHILPYRKARDTRPASDPRMILVGEGVVAFVQFSDAASVISLADDSPFRETLVLKDPWDRMLGFGQLPHQERNDTAEITVTTASRGLLTFRMDLAKIHGSHPDTPTNHLKATMEQAIFFGASLENPFLFRLEPRLEGNLGAAAERISQEILSSRCEFMRATLDLRAQLTDRCTRLRSLIGFINENGALGQLSQTSRQRLAHDAEKLFAANNLWAYHNKYPVDVLSQRGQSRNLLVAAIERYMHKTGEAIGGDFVRLFFKTKINDIGALCEEIYQIVQGASSPYEQSQDWTIIVPEASRIVLNLYESALHHRAETSALYGIDTKAPFIERWSGLPVQLDMLQLLFDSTSHLLQEASQNANPVYDQRDRNTAAQLKLQLQELAAIVFSSFRDRLSYLTNLPAEEGNEREMVALQDRFANTRPQVARALVKYDSAEKAFQLAEEYRDFRILAELSNEFSESSGHRTARYIELYREDFAYELYQRYIEKGKLRILLEQDEKYNELLDGFFRNNSYPRIEWIHDIATSKYHEAGRVLLGEAQNEPKLASKHIMLSIAKLAVVATLPNLDTDDAQEYLGTLDEPLDFISVHETLLAEFTGALGLNARSTPEGQAEVVTSTVALHLSDRPALQALFKRLAKALFQGKALQEEDLVDLLTLKDNKNSAGDFHTALGVLLRANNLPEARHQTALRNIWERVYTHDNWDRLRSTSNLTDENLNDLLRQTTLYATIQLCHQADHPDAYILPPTVLPAPSNAEIAARFSDLAAAQVEGLEVDYQLGRQRVKALVRERDLDKWFERVVMLEQADRSSGSVGDDTESDH
ncbi:hypothetical protein BOTBODRAFT_192479 [Botryobasidium botryosum FD-172 SS1]|uniref:Nucleoporin Nup133/Nup155-like C-terminal domain-containing protein n=1 Tax=Botryobasidium botryosum (strain FD-172 SS1) TaxID=930990 RepID=A0A067M718_BOTB1|nr:hypothetical protein BOTBODRAFT_192479 [Botryobasidium botryosum FD-172 SS1]